MSHLATWKNFPQIPEECSFENIIRTNVFAIFNQRAKQVKSKKIRLLLCDNNEASRPIDPGTRSRHGIYLFQRLAESAGSAALDGVSPRDNEQENELPHFAMILLQRESGAPSILLLMNA
jgi:hypothetical protein